MSLTMSLFMYVTQHCENLVQEFVLLFLKLCFFAVIEDINDSLELADAAYGWLLARFVLITTSKPWFFNTTRLTSHDIDVGEDGLGEDGFIVLQLILEESAVMLVSRIIDLLHDIYTLLYFFFGSRNFFCQFDTFYFSLLLAFFPHLGSKSAILCSYFRVWGCARWNLVHKSHQLLD